MRLEEDAGLNDLRMRVRNLVAAEGPELRGQRTGVRAPEPDEIPALREWTSRLFGEKLLGAHWPVEHGGVADAHPEHESVVFEELAKLGAPGTLGAGMLAAAAIIASGSEAQKDTFLPRIRSGTDIWCQLFSEPEAGSDLAGMRTRARREGDQFVVDGQKVWTTNGQHADWGYLLARTNADVPKHAGITAFALDMRTPGVIVRPLREITGTSDFNEVFFDNVCIPADNVIGAVDGGWPVAQASLALERSGAGGGWALRDALDRLITLAQNVQVDGTPALDRHDVRQQIGELASEVHANAITAAFGESRRLNNEGDIADAPISKILFSEVNLRLHEYGMTLQGHDGVRIEHDNYVIDDGWWQDAFLYARAFTIAGGTNEVLRNVIAERALRLPKG